MVSKNIISFNSRIWNLDELPERISIEIVFGCNLKCGMCHVPNTKERKFKLMDTWVFETIINQLDSKKTVHLNIDGEPLLHPNIVQFIHYAKEKGHIVGFATNATKLTEELSQKLIESKLDYITFSIDGGTPETYEKIRKGASFSAVVQNVKTFCALNQKKGVDTRVDCILSDLTEPEIDKICDLWEGVTRVNFIPLDDWAGQITLPNEYGEKRTPKYENKGLYSRWPCHLLWTTMSVSAEGRYMLCCHDYHFYSKLPFCREKSLIDVWQDEIAFFRQKMAIGDYNDLVPCSNCPAWLTMPEYYRNGLKTRIYDSLRTQMYGIYNAIKSSWNKK